VYQKPKKVHKSLKILSPQYELWWRGMGAMATPPEVPDLKKGHLDFNVST
jgi:hypothetical protein